MTLTAIDCQSFAGGFSLGVNQAGFKVIAKREHAGGFGSPLALANRHLLGYDWELQAGNADTWTPMAADLVFGNPPCAGFSTRSVGIYGGPGNATQIDYRGVNSPANSCMWDFVRYAAKCNPQVAIFESVQQAYTGGVSLMRELRDEFEKLTGRQVYLTHVLHSNSALGGFAGRNRYFWVVSDRPFSVTVPVLERRLTVRDAIGDLEDKGPEDIEGHVSRNTPGTRRLSELAAKVDWFQGEKSGDAYRRAVELGITIEAGELTNAEKGTSQYAQCRMHYDRPAPVITGRGLTEFVHPTLNRFITHREVARLMGYPDEWICEPAIAANSKGELWWGKGIPVGSGRWIAEQAANYIKGDEGKIFGTELGEREYMIHVEKWLKDNQPPTDLPEPLFELEQCC